MVNNCRIILGAAAVRWFGSASSWLLFAVVPAVAAAQGVAVAADAALHAVLAAALPAVVVVVLLLRLTPTRASGVIEEGTVDSSVEAMICFSNSHHAKTPYQSSL